MKKPYLVFIASFFLSMGAYAQLVITGEIRPRAEFRNGFKRLHADDADPAFFIEQRSRLYVDFSKEQITMRISIQDVRLWGENNQVFKSDNAFFGIHEAWGQYNFNEKFKIRVGRQELDYDNARILGDLSWAQQSRTHDALKLAYEVGKYKWHLGAAYNQEDVLSKPEPARLAGTFYGGVNNYKTMQYSWLHYTGENSTWSLLLLNNGLQDADSSVHFSQTLGGNVETSVKKIKCTVEAWYQLGKDGQGRDLNAYLLSFNIGFKVGDVPVVVGTDHLSGTEVSSTKSTSFDPLYGTHHKFYGFMDYFYVGNSHGNIGLTDLYARSRIKLGEKSILNIHLHEFFSDARIVTEQAQRMSKNLGTEIDLVYAVTIAPEVSLNLGYSQLFGTSSMEVAKGGEKNEWQNWAWAMLTIKPKIFENKSNHKTAEL